MTKSVALKLFCHIKQKHAMLKVHLKSISLIKFKERQFQMENQKKKKKKLNEVTCKFIQCSIEGHYNYVH